MKTNMLCTMAIVSLLTCFGTMAHAQSSESDAVREYEQYRLWKDQGHVGDYEDFLKWQEKRKTRKSIKKNRRSSANPPQRRPNEDRFNHNDEWEVRNGKEVDDARSQPPRRRRPMIDELHNPVPRPRLPGHDRCVNHYDEVIMFDGFPCRIVRPCKECGELVTLHAQSYEYDKRGTLEDIRYRESPCPQCNETVKLKISFDD